MLRIKQCDNLFSLTQIEGQSKVKRRVVKKA